MPELPEVETTRCGIAPHAVGHEIVTVSVRDGRLRRPVTVDVSQGLSGQVIRAVDRRAKYLLFRCDTGTLIWHLGMSGSLRVVQTGASPGPHDHVDVVLANERILRFRDPRRFGLMMWTPDDPLDHPLLRRLGPEPLDDEFDGRYLRRRASGRRIPIKGLIMDGKVVAGVGNIYANESLARAGIDPRRAAGRVSEVRCQRLSNSIKAVLREAIELGGTTLRDFVREDGRPGYFRLELRVYGRTGQPCQSCGLPIKGQVIGQRSTYFCPRCQR